MTEAGKNIKKISMLVLAAVLCFTLFASLFAETNEAEAATDATVAALEAKITSLQSQKKDMQKKINAAKNERAEAYEYKNYIDSQLNLTTEEISTIDALIKELDTKIAEKENEITAASKSIEEQYNNFKQIMRLSYEEGNASYIELVLGADDFYDFLVRIEQVSALMEYSTGLLNEYKKSKEELENAKRSLETSKSDQLIYKEELDAKQDELDALQAENEAFLETVSKNISSYTASYNKFAKAEEELDRELENYLKELQAKENAAYVGGEFMWPVPLSWKSISSGYGNRTLGGVKEFHRGIDIPASKGTDIYAANGGKVVTAKFHSSYGNYVVIDHGGGKSTLYAHATKLNCKVGDAVKRGDVVAFVGTTGNSRGYHLHFEVRINGAHTNPLSYVKKP